MRKAHETQIGLSKRIIFEDRLPRKIRLIAGIDVAYFRNVSIGAAVVLDYDSLKPVESQTATCRTSFPYIPTLLSFRELPPVLAAFRRLSVQPDIIMIDGQGFAHPYRCGFACHLGLILNKPTIGVAKSRLIGEAEEDPAEKDVALLKDKSEVLGAIVTTRIGSAPVFVSVGHMISLKSAISIVKHCIHENRVPEPILKAHEAASSEKRKIQIHSPTNKREAK